MKVELSSIISVSAIARPGQGVALVVTGEMTTEQIGRLLLSFATTLPEQVFIDLLGGVCPDYLREDLK